MLPLSIVITEIEQPATGAVMIQRCPICKVVDIQLNEYAPRPERGDAWLVELCCQKEACVMENLGFLTRSRLTETPELPEMEVFSYHRSHVFRNPTKKKGG